LAAPAGVLILPAKIKIRAGLFCYGRLAPQDVLRENAPGMA
jgi:hypothetical protein